MDFPHINDTKYPDISTVDVYKFQNTFDYARWTGKVAFKLCNVLWNSNYADVPKFETDEKRDEWFDAVDGIVWTSESAFNNTPENSIRVPIPYNDAYRYNYLVVEMPMQTSDGNPIDYENDKTRVKQWHFFVDSMEQLSPSTTEIYITLDYWTQFINTVDIPYLMLERGHAPMALSDVDEYLQNPLENSEYLLADDYNYGKERVISKSSYIPIGNGKKWVMFAVPIEAADFANLGGSTLSGQSIPPTYANDSSIRWGYQIIVNDYEWKYGNANYSNAQLPITAMADVDGNVFNGCYVYAIESENAYEFFNELAKSCVHLLHAIQAVFVLAEDMITLYDTFVFRGYQLRKVRKRNVEINFTLNKEAFEFDEKYENITKLYTFPYSSLEITDDDGFVAEVRIENISNLQFHREVSTAFPFVRYNMFFTGINGSGSYAYNWVDLNGSNVNKEMWESDFSKFMMNWDIPTYTVFASAESDLLANNYAGLMNDRERALVNYRNAIRFANTGYDNTADTMATNTANVGRQTTAQKTNSNHRINFNNANYDANSQANVENMQHGNDFNYNSTQWNMGKMGDDYAYANQASRAALNLDFDAASVAVGSSVISGVTSVLGATVGGALSDGKDGAAKGAATSAIGAIGGVVGTAYTSYATCSNKADYELAMEEINNGQVINSQNVLDNLNRLQREFNEAVCNTNNANMREITTHNNNLDSITTDVTNAMQNANALASQNTETNNANWTRYVGVNNAQENLVQAQRDAEARFRNARLQAPVSETESGGNAYPDIWERRGVRVNVRKQTKSAIAQTGDAMLRFGYALHRVWDMSNGFDYMKYFTFWKAEDIWINEGNGLAGNAVNVIGDILMKGVTVWNDPEKIGKVGLYDNWKEV